MSESGHDEIVIPHDADPELSATAIRQALLSGETVTITICDPPRHGPHFTPEQVERVHKYLREKYSQSPEKE